MPGSRAGRRNTTTTCGGRAPRAAAASRLAHAQGRGHAARGREPGPARCVLQAAARDRLHQVPDERRLHHRLPERREERTTEGGLDVVMHFDKVKAACDKLAAHGIRVSLFIGPDIAQIDAVKKMRAPVIELHTGTFADAESESAKAVELARIKQAVAHAKNLGLIVNAGHGLHYHNVHEIAEIEGLEELNIGHAIVAHAIFVGWDNAVREMKALMKESAPA